MVVTSFSATPVCSGSGSPNTEVSLLLSKDKAHWVKVGEGVGGVPLSGVTKLKARYAKWRVEVREPFIGPGSISLTVDSKSLSGVKLKE